jgi:hypothetical protein
MALTLLATVSAQALQNQISQTPIIDRPLLTDVARLLK